jgi:hypothetical protein
MKDSLLDGLRDYVDEGGGGQVQEMAAKKNWISLQRVAQFKREMEFSHSGKKQFLTRAVRHS